MKPFLYTSFGNPSSIHTYGQEVRRQQNACGHCRLVPR
jgi:cysteine sulfinate desulfinase/cysteine desulfurase-like protein